jgi:complex iron-sulfur molybdoenzyme family reductase subunit gamma
MILRRVLPAVLLLAAAVPAAAADFLSAETLEVAKVPGPLAADPSAPFWDSVPVAVVAAAPQHTIRLNDRQANEALEKATLRSVRVRAATDGKELAVLLEWADATENRTRPDAVDAYGDAAAIQFPRTFGAGIRLPYVGMGDEGQEVLLYLQRAGVEGSAPRQVVARGFGTSSRSDLGGVRVGMRYDATRKGWRAVFQRAISAAGHDLGRALVPFSVAVWDGAGHERGGNKALAAWKFLRMPGMTADPAYLAELAWGTRPGDLGDPRKGRELFEGMCTACHAVGAERAVPGLAPDLTVVGVIATPGYLRDSIVAPSTVIVPNPNPAQRQDRAATPDARGAYPPDEAYVWYTRGADGKRTSTMPDYASMDPGELRDIVAYLTTLGRDDVPEGKKP